MLAVPTVANRPDPARKGETAFVLGGGGVLGANEVGMLQALLAAGITPDLVLGTSVGAVNGAVVASDPTEAAVERLTSLWRSSAGAVWRTSPVRRVRAVARTRTSLQTADPLRSLLVEHLGDGRIEDLAVPFECCAASIERAAEHWFDRGPLVDAVLASCAVPGLYPPVKINGEHYLDGGLVNSIPVGRAVERGATTVYVIQVGRVERPLTVPTRPWEVATVAFEIARRHRFARDMAAVPPGIRVHVLPSGEDRAPTTGRYREAGAVGVRIARAYDASAAYLAAQQT